MKLLHRTVLLCAVLLSTVGCWTHPWFESRFPWEEQPDPNQRPILTHSAGERISPPEWALPVDACLKEEGTLRSCADIVPPQ